MVIGAIHVFALLILLLSATVQDSSRPKQTKATVLPPFTSKVCHVTYPDGSSPPGEQTHPDVGYGNKGLWVGISPTGHMAVRRGRDGWLWAPKIAWVRGVHGHLMLTGRRLDRPAPPMRSRVYEYQDIGFQPTSLGFPSEGCWEVTGRVGPAKLTFVSEVRIKENW